MKFNKTAHDEHESQYHAKILKKPFNKVKIQASPWIWQQIHDNAVHGCDSVCKTFESPWDFWKSAEHT